MTERRIILFRGMNTGGVRAPVAEQRAMAQALGLANPRTLLASGNLVVDSDRDPREIEAMVETETALRFGRRIGTLVKTTDEWDALVAANPFPSEGVEAPSRLLVVMFREPIPPGTLEATAAFGAGDERAAQAAGALWLWLPDGIGHSAMAEKAPPGPAGLVTARNWNTVLKLAGMVRRADP